MHCVKARDGVRSEFRERLSNALYRLWRLTWVTLGEEFVGIADDPFFQGLWQQVPNWRDGQVLRDNLLGRDTGTRMPLTHPTMTIQPHRVKHLTTKDTMQDILLHLHEGRSVWQVKRDAVCDYVHPTQKPIALAGIGIKNSTAKGHIVLDLFGGSGSTLMAAEQLQRKARVMEYDPHYVDCIIARWEQFTGQKAKLLTNTKTAEP